MPVNGFRWVKNTSDFDEDSIGNFHEGSDEGYFFEVDVQYPEKLHKINNDLPFLSERIKSEKVWNFWSTCMTKNNMSYTFFKTSTK